MIEHKVRQGTPAWLELRERFFTASEASAMMGDSKHKSRDKLLAIAVGDHEPQEPGEFTAKLFAKGHAAEESARPIIEAMIDQELFPITATRDNLLASFDGLTMLNDIVFEHKLWNEKLASAVSLGDLDDHYKWQLDQQLYVSGADRAIFVVSDGTSENMACLWYERDEQRIKRLLAGWKQFEKDLAAYKPVEKKLKAVDHEAGLPEIRANITAVVSDNTVSDFAALVIEQTNLMKTDLVNDKDFAEAEGHIKWCKNAEEKVDAAVREMFNQSPDIKFILDTLGEAKSSLSGKRLELDKLVKQEKKLRQNEVIAKAALKVGNEERLRNAAKGKKNLDTFRAAVNDEVARIQVEHQNGVLQPPDTRDYISITFKDLKSGPRLIRVVGLHGIGMDLCAEGNGEIKTIQIEVNK